MNNLLRQQIKLELARVEQLRAAIVRQCETEWLPDTDPYSIRSPDGTYLMSSVIEARANLLLAMALLEARPK